MLVRVVAVAASIAITLGVADKVVFDGARFDRLLGFLTAGPVPT